MPFNLKLHQRAAQNKCHVIFKDAPLQCSLFDKTQDVFQEVKIAHSILALIFISSFNMALI